MNKRNPNLTARELELIEKHGNDCDFDREELCKALHISLGTYKAHIRSIISKTYSVNQYEAFFKLAAQGKINNKRWELI